MTYDFQGKPVRSNWMIGVVGLLIFFLNLAGPSRADDLEPAEPVPEYSGMSPVLCLGCHGPDGMKPAAGILLFSLRHQIELGPAGED